MVREAAHCTRIRTNFPNDVAGRSAARLLRNLARNSEGFAGTSAALLGPCVAAGLARMTVAPIRVNYHLEHHLVVAVPWFRLPAQGLRGPSDRQLRAVPPRSRPRATGRWLNPSPP